MNYFSFIIFYGLCLFSFSITATASIDRPKVVVEEVNFVEDKRNIIVPVKVEAKIQSLVSAEIEGHVTKLLKPLGSSVKAGEIILFLENKDPGFTFAAVPIRAPIAGVISQIWTSQMAKVNRGEKLFAVINPKSLKLVTEIPSDDLSLIQRGLVGRFKVETQNEASLPIRVVGISPLVDARTGTASAELEFIDLKQGLPPIGSIGQVTFDIVQGKIIKIPEASLLFQEGKPMVRVLKDQNQFDKKPIVLGEQRDSSFIVKSGISQGDKIVVRSSRPLKEGDTLDIQSPSEKTR